MMPVCPELTATTQVGDCEEETVLYEKSRVSIELRCSAGPESTIAGQKSRERSRRLIFFLGNQRNRDFRPIFRFVSSLFDFYRRRVKWYLCLGPSLVFATNRRPEESGRGMIERRKPAEKAIAFDG